MKDKLRFSPPAVGGASLLVSIALLCLTVFALLCLTSAQAETRLEERTRQAVEDYYRADVRAQELFSRLKNGELPPEVAQKDGIYTYVCEISPTQTLCVTLQNQNGHWQVLQWQARAALPVEEDQTLPVWNGTINEEGNP